MQIKFNLRRLRAFTFIAACVAVLAASSLAHANGVTFSRTSEAGAEGIMEFNTSLIVGFVFVTRTGSLAAPETFLSYLVIDRLTGLAIHDGSGIIPNEAFTSTASSGRLLVDTSSIAGFVHSTGAGGQLDILWTNSGTVETRSMGTTQIKMPTSKITIAGQRTLKAAVNQGSFLGQIVQGVINSTLGTNREVTITVVR